MENYFHLMHWAGALTKGSQLVAIPMGYDLPPKSRVGSLRFVLGKMGKKFPICPQRW